MASLGLVRVELGTLRRYAPFETLAGRWGMVEARVGDGGAYAKELEPFLEDPGEAPFNVVVGWEDGSLSPVRPDLVVEVMR